MTTITPQPPPPPAPPPSAPRALPSVIVANPPESLTKLAAGTQFEGTVAAAGGKSAVQLTTLHGTLQILTTLPLEKGARLSLILQNLAPQLQLQIAAIDGKAPHLALRGGATAPQQPAAPAAESVPQGQAAPSGPAALIGSRTTLTLLRPPAALSASATPTAAAPPPTAAATPPAGPPGPAAPVTTPTPPATTPISQPATTAPASPTPTPPPPTVPQGTQLPVSIKAVRLPTPGAPLPPSPAAAQALPAAGQTLTATVSGATPQGPAILQTPLGPVTITTATPLPSGTQLTLEVTGRAVPPEATKPPPPPQSPLTLFRAQDWPTLREAYQVLQQVDPQAAHQLATQTLPRPDGQLAANVLFFIAALRGGDVGSWLGDRNLRVLERARPGLATRLGEEFRQMGAFVRDNLIGDWRLALIPFFAGPDPEQVRLFMKPYGGEDDDDGAPQGIRFVVDVDLSRLGRLQLDGLVRDDNKRLDLIVRSEAPLPAAMQNDIRAIFENAAELTGVGGAVGFQAAPPDFVDLAPEPRAGDSPGIVA